MMDDGLHFGPWRFPDGLFPRIGDGDTQYEKYVVR